MEAQLLDMIKKQFPVDDNESSDAMGDTEEV